MSYTHDHGHVLGPLRMKTAAGLRSAAPEIGRWIEESLAHAPGHVAPSSLESLGHIARPYIPSYGGIRSEAEMLAKKVRAIPGAKARLPLSTRMEVNELLRPGGQNALPDVGGSWNKRGSYSEKLSAYMGVAQERNMEKSAAYQQGAYAALVEYGIVKVANEGMEAPGGDGHVLSAPNPSDEELVHLLSQMSPEELQHVLGEVPQDNMSQAMGGMDEQQLVHMLSQLPEEELHQILAELEGQGGGAPEGAPAGLPGVDGGEGGGAPEGLEAAEGEPEEAPESEEEAAEAGAPGGGTKGGFPFGKGKGPGSKKPAGKKGDKKDEKKGKKDEKTEKKEKKDEKTEKKAFSAAGLAQGAHGLFRGAGRMVGAHALEGAGLGGIAGAIRADDGHRGTGFLRGAGVGALAGAGAGAVRHGLMAHSMTPAMANRGVVSKAMADLGNHAAGFGGALLPAAFAAGAGSAAGSTAQKSPWERLKSHIPFAG